VMPTPSEMPEAMRTRSQYATGICVEIIYGPLRRVQTEDEDMIHAPANDKSGDLVDLTHCAMGVESRFVSYVAPAAISATYNQVGYKSVEVSCVKETAPHVGDDMGDGGEFGGRCEANPEPSVAMRENALRSTRAMACVETRCRPLRCVIGDEGIVHAPAKDKLGATVMSGVSDGLLHVSSAENYHPSALLPACGGVYSITNLVNGKQYVGSSRNIRARVQIHRSGLRLLRHHSPPLQNAWNKYGIDAFRIEILERCSDLDKLYALEQLYMDKLQPNYNVGPVAGSPRGVKRSPEVEAKRLEAYIKAYAADKDRINSLRSASMREHWSIPEQRTRRVASLAGRDPAQLKEARRHHRPDWTPEMDAILLEHYPAEGRFVASRIAVTESSARHRANRLGLHTTRGRGGRRRRVES
jgi:group I intron endonuclease